MHASRALAAFVLGGLVVTACADDDPHDADAPSESELDGRLHVPAASTLAVPFEDVEAAFEDAHPGVDVQVDTAPSADLAASIIEGASADVFASIDAAHLQAVVDEGLAEGDATPFATNTLQIIVRAGNPLGIDELEDLTAPEVSLSLCQLDAPCGGFAKLAFEAAGLPVPPAGHEDSSAAVLARVSSGEADAGLMYVTHLRGTSEVEGIDLADDEQATVVYPATVLTETRNPDAAAAFVEFLTGPEVQDILEGYGFGVP